jgi:hypothetical protein
MQELNALKHKAKHGSVYPLSKPEYSREVTEASREGPVLVNLTSSLGTNVESRVLSDLWRQAAVEYGEVKFCEMRAEQAIEGYPERHCPTILIYDKGDVVEQVITLATLGGPRMGMSELDKLLVKVGALKDNDIRVLKRRRLAEEAEDDGERKSSLFTSRGRRQKDEDDGWH